MKMKKLTKPKIDVRVRADEKNDGRLFRAVEFKVETRDCEDGKKKAVIRASVSSEAPYLRQFIWDEEEDGWRKGYEVLGHGEGEIDFSRMADGLVIQDTHWGDQIGIMRSKSRTGRLSARSSSAAENVRRRSRKTQPQESVGT